MNEIEEKNHQDAQSELLRIFPHYFKMGPSLDSILSEIFTAQSGAPPAEKYIFDNVNGMPTKKVLNYNPHLIPIFAITDKEAKLVSDYLGCIPEEAEKCYSILRYVKSRNVGGTNALVFSTDELKDFIYWTINPSTRCNI